MYFLFLHPLYFIGFFSSTVKKEMSLLKHYLDVPMIRHLFTTPPRAIILFLHDMGDSKNSSFPFIHEIFSLLKSENIAIYVPDLRGHGENTHKHIESPLEIIQDISTILSIIDSEWPQQRIQRFIMGIGMGAIFAHYFASKKPISIQGWNTYFLWDFNPLPPDFMETTARAIFKARISFHPSNQARKCLFRKITYYNPYILPSLLSIPPISMVSVYNIMKMRAEAFESFNPTAIFHTWCWDLNPIDGKPFSLPSNPTWLHSFSNLVPRLPREIVHSILQKIDSFVHIPLS